MNRSRQLAGLPAPASSRAVVPTTAVIPTPDTLTRAPVLTCPGAASSCPADASSIEDPPTLRVPVRPATAFASPLPPAITPPPLSDLKFSCSEWSSDGELVPLGAQRAPRIGDTVAGFKLVGELGRGAFARVFLAEQEALANRSVALKVTLRPTREAERLARLQHTNIVPVYSVHEVGSAQVICMPFLGRVTIADLIRAYRVDQPSRQTGRKSTSARAIRTTTTDSKSKYNPKSDGYSSSSRAPTWTWAAEDPPPIVGDPAAVLQVLSQLAAGLSHAHERGILHLDLKPANVLLADTGEPMLLDFNLSFDASNPARELVGGTMPYMAIEQLLDMRAHGKGTIDQRTDLYSLGVMAFEMLTGTVLFPTSSKGMRDLEALVELRRKGPPSIRKLNPAVTPAVEAIVRKLLASEPADRYQTAEELRIDIDRHLNDQPLKYAREASIRERMGKWRRRNPGMPLRVLTACLVVLAISLGGVAYHRAEANARTQAIEHAKETRQALDAIRLDLIFPSDAKVQARGIKQATEILATYGLPGEKDWKKHPDVQRLSETELASLGGDLGELMVLLAEVKWNEANIRPESERQVLIAEAWKLNTIARTCFDDKSMPPMLNQQTKRIAQAVGEEFVIAADAPQEPASSREQFLEAAYSIKHGRYAGAMPFLEQVIADQPNHAADQFCLAFCRQQMGQYDRAIERYDVAQAMLPADPRPTYQLAIISMNTRQPEEAEKELTKVIKRVPNFAEAYRSRAIARYRIGKQFTDLGQVKEAATKFAEAEADLNAAFERGELEIYVRWIRACVRDARGDRAGAEADRAATKGIMPKTELEYLVRGWSRMKHDPKAALTDFQKAAELNPRSLTALQNQAHILAEELNDNPKALIVATKVAELYPEFAPALAGRAVVLARLERRKEAHEEIERARLISSNDRETLYQAACVYSLTSQKNPEDQTKAIALLRESLKKGAANSCRMKKDPDLDVIRDTQEFKDIQQAATTLYR